MHNRRLTESEMTKRIKENQLLIRSNLNMTSLVDEHSKPRKEGQKSTRRDKEEVFLFDESKSLLKKKRRERMNCEREQILALAVPGYLDFVFKH